MSPSKILCAVDFSADSKTALVQAAEFASQLRASMVLVHVQERPLWMNPPYVHLPGDVRLDILRQTEAELEQWASDARRLLTIDQPPHSLEGSAARPGGAGTIDQPPHSVSTKLLEGVPWEVLVNLARDDREVGWIVVGSHGRTGIERVVMGSVAERVVRHAPCSVLVARARSDQ